MYVGLRFIALLLLLVVAAYFDSRYRRVPNWLTYSMLGVGVLLAVLPKVGMGLPPDSTFDFFRYGLAGMLVGGGVTLLLYLGGGIGGGDVKLCAAMGMLAGPADTIRYLFFGALAGAALILVRLAWRGEILAAMNSMWRRPLRLIAKANSSVRAETLTTPQTGVAQTGQAEAQTAEKDATKNTPPQTVGSFALGLALGVFWVWGMASADAIFRWGSS